LLSILPFVPLATDAALKVILTSIADVDEALFSLLQFGFLQDFQENINLVFGKEDLGSDVN